ncbi:O-antigen ligase family protein [Chthonobacter rhizosphaerae]|uniref:O-antigen ligase family protein n=1 Tax=Chthonobacter rhizosphaerae TaxID=2735553 RepID=UPI0015EE8FBA|nr:O-antigen ligase family protein [Chthonobacter rhizosphaerae]
MSAIASSAPSAYGLVSVKALRDGGLWFAVFLGGFVIVEPAPYELALALLIPLYFLGGLKLRGAFAPLLALVLVYNAGGFLSVTQIRPEKFSDGLLYMAVSLFLGLTSVWFAALVAEDWRRIRVIERTYVGTAVLVSAIGILGYFRLLPGSDQFLLYGRAKATFQDPNVFGPFLLLPALILARRIMTAPLARNLGALAMLAVLAIGIFLSFSRAAWAMLAFGLPLLAAVVSATATTNRARLRLIGLGAAGIAAAAVLVAVAMSIPAVSDLLVQRAKLVQDYDAKTGAELGRFARHWVGFALSAEHPLGIGPYEFPLAFVEATHNTYLKSILEYGWLGFSAYVTLVAMTLVKGLPLAFQPRPWQPFAQCVLVSFVLHLLVGWIIDTDHWRHMYLAFGLIWGLVAVERYHRAGRFPTR